jgi:transposase
LICREVQVNLAYRWFCKLGIEDVVPDHSAVSRARNERFRDGGVIRRVFERIVETCIAAGLVGGEGFAVDASLIAAVASRALAPSLPTIAALPSRRPLQLRGCQTYDGR